MDLTVGGLICSVLVWYGHVWHGPEEEGRV